MADLGERIGGLETGLGPYLRVWMPPLSPHPAYLKVWIGTALTEKVTFVFRKLSLTNAKCYPFHIHSLELFIPSAPCCKNTVFKLWINHKTRTFPRLFHIYNMHFSRGRVGPLFWNFADRHDWCCKNPWSASLADSREERSKISRAALSWRTCNLAIRVVVTPVSPNYIIS